MEAHIKALRWQNANEAEAPFINGIISYVSSSSVLS